MFALLKPTFSLPPRPYHLTMTLQPTAERSPTDIILDTIPQLRQTT